MDRSVVGTGQYFKGLAFLNERGRSRMGEHEIKKTKEQYERRGKYWLDAMDIEFHVYLTFKTAGIITAVQCWCSFLVCFLPALFTSSVLLSQPRVDVCVCVCVFSCMHVRIWVYLCVCMLELQIKTKLSCFDCSLREPAAQGLLAEEKTHTHAHTFSPFPVSVHSYSSASFY